MAGSTDAELFVEWKTGVPMALADTNRSTFLPSGPNAAIGLVPAPPTSVGTSLFLREDATWAAPSFIIATGSVTNEMLASMAEGTIKGRALGAGTGSPQDLTASQARAIIGPGLVYLNSGSVAASTSVVDIILTSYTNFRGLQILINNFIPITDGDDFWLLVSDDGGASFDTGASDYSWVNLVSYDDGGGVTETNTDTADSEVLLINNVGNASDEGVSFVANLIGQNNSALKPKIWGNGNMIVNSTLVLFSFSGSRNAAQITNAIRLKFATSTIASGEWAIYGFA